MTRSWPRTRLARLDTPAAAGLDAGTRPAEGHVVRLLRPAGPGAGEALRQTLMQNRRPTNCDRTRDRWDRRRKEFQIRTPDPHLNALINWERCRSEYHRQGPGLVLGGQIWQMYSHISTGWYGKQWGGDHQAMDDCLRLYGAMQADDGFIRWVSPSLIAVRRREQHAVLGRSGLAALRLDRRPQFVRDLWPIVRKAVAWQRKHNDPDGDGLFRDWYEYWNCDSNGKGPKAAAPSAMSWAMLDRAAQLAEVVGDEQGRRRVPRAGRQDPRRRSCASCGARRPGGWARIGADGIWRGHPQTWEEYLAINAGLLSPEQGRRAMRWLASHYGFEPQPGVQLLACSDWFPIRWSTQWVPTGDTCLAALGGHEVGRRRPLVAVPEDGGRVGVQERLPRHQHGHLQRRGRRRRPRGRGLGRPARPRGGARAVRHRAGAARGPARHLPGLPGRLARGEHLARRM